MIINDHNNNNLKIMIIIYNDNEWFQQGIFVNTLVITLEAVYIFLPVGARRNFKSLFRFIYMQGRISSSWFCLCNIWIWPDNEFGPLLIGLLIIANWCILCRNFHHWCSDMILIFISEWQPTAFFEVCYMFTVIQSWAATLLNI